MKDKSKKLTVVNTDNRKPAPSGESTTQVVGGGSFGGISIGGGLDYLLKAVWDKVWEIKTDSQGNEYIFGKLPVVTQYGITMYADGGELNLPSIYAGIPFDNKTIWLNPETKKVEVIGGTGGGVADSVHWNNIEGKPSFSAVATSGKYADLSGLPNLNVYATTEYLTAELKKYVTLNTEQTIGAHKNFLNGLSIGGLGITKSQDDVLYIDGNLAVRGGITMYATDAIDVPSIIDALPIASASAKGIAAFNPNDFSVVDGYVSFIGKGGIDESVLADYAKKTDLSKYLPLSGGKVTGQIEYNFDWGGNIPAAGAISFGSIDELPLLKSFIGNGLNTTYNKWVDIISVRADNGSSQFGMYLVTSMKDSMDSLSWNRQAYGTWQGERVILDSVNWSQYISAGQVGAYLPQSGGNMSGHIFMTGAVADSSTANTSQLVFGTSANNHVCLTSNMKGLIINPSLNDTSGQIALYADVNMESFIQSSLKVYGSLYASVYFNYGGSIAQSYGSSMYVWDNNLQINKTTSGNDYLKTMMFFDLISENIKLNINGKLSFNSYILWNSDSNNPYMAITYGGRDWYLQAYNNSYIYLGTGVASSIRIDTSGNLLTSGGITMYSDIRKKTKLQDVELTLQQIADAPLIQHYYNSDEQKTTHVGSIAQYWAGLNDWFCKLDGEGFYTMEIQNAALASAISVARELVKYETKTDRKIRLLKNRVKELEDKIEKLENN